MAFSQKSHLENVLAFHQKFGVPVGARPAQLPAEDFLYRVAFMHEELNELMLAYLQGDLAKQVDALLDLEYVLLGTALWMGLAPIWAQAHAEVHRANMAKEKAQTKAESFAATGRWHKFDVIKPPGWTAPDLDGILNRW